MIIFLLLIKKRDLFLIKSTLKGNNDSFAKLMTYYKQRVLVFGKSFFHNETDAEDFVQDVFIKVFNPPILPSFSVYKDGFLIKSFNKSPFISKTLILALSNESKSE